MAAGVLDETVFHRLTQGLQEEMMIAMLNTLQVAANCCAEVCATKLRMMHEEMIQAVERAQAESMGGAPPDFRREVSFEGIMKELKDAKPALPRKLDASHEVSEIDGDEEMDEDGARALEAMYDGLDAAACKPSSPPATKAPSLAAPTRRMRRRPIEAAAKVEEKSKATGDQNQQRSAISRLSSAGFGLPSSQQTEAPQARRETLPEKVKIAPVFQVALAAPQATMGEKSSSQKAKQDAAEEDSEAATESEDEVVKEAMRSQEQQKTNIQELSEKTPENSLQATTRVSSSGSDDPKEDGSLSGATVFIDAKSHEIGEAATRSPLANLTGAASPGGNLVADRVCSEPSSGSPALGSMQDVEGAMATLSQSVDMLSKPASESKVQGPWWALPSAQGLNMQRLPRQRDLTSGMLTQGDTDQAGLVPEMSSECFNTSWWALPSVQGLNMHLLQKPVGADNTPESMRLEEVIFSLEQPGQNELTNWWSLPSAQGLCMHPLPRRSAHGTHTELDSLRQLAAQVETVAETAEALSCAWWSMPSANGLNMHPLPKLASIAPQRQDLFLGSNEGSSSNLCQASRQEEVQGSHADLHEIDCTRAEWWALPSAQGLNMMPLLKPSAPRTETAADCLHKSASSGEVCLRASEDEALVLSADSGDARGSATTNLSDNSVSNSRAWWALPSSHGLNMHRLRGPIETSISDLANSTVQQESTHTSPNQISDLQAATDDGLNSGVFQRSGVLTAEHAIHKEEAIAFAQSDPGSSVLVVENATAGELVREQDPLAPAFNAIETATGPFDLLPCENQKHNLFVPPPREGARSSTFDFSPRDVPSSSSCDLPPASGIVQNHPEQTCRSGSQWWTLPSSHGLNMHPLPSRAAGDISSTASGIVHTDAASGKQDDDIVDKSATRQTSLGEGALATQEIDLGAGLVSVERAAGENLVSLEDFLVSSTSGAPILRQLPAEQTSPQEVAPVAGGTEVVAGMLTMEETAVEEMAAPENPSSPSSRRSSGVGEPPCDTLSFFLREPATEETSLRVGAVEKREETDLVAGTPTVEQATGEESVAPEDPSVPSVLGVPGVREPTAEQTSLEADVLSTEGIELEVNLAAAEDPSAPSAPRIPGGREPTTEQTSLEVGPLATEETDGGVGTPIVEHAAFEQLVSQGDTSAASTPGTTGDGELATQQTSPGAAAEIELRAGMLIAKKPANEEVAAGENPSASSTRAPSGVGNPPAEPSSMAVGALATEEADLGDWAPTVEQAAFEELVAPEDHSAPSAPRASGVRELAAAEQAFPGVGALAGEECDVEAKTPTSDKAAGEELAALEDPAAPSAPSAPGIGKLSTEQTSLRVGAIASEVTDLGAGTLTVEHAAAEEFVSQGNPLVPSAPRPIGVEEAAPQTSLGVGDLATKHTHPGAEMLTADKAAHEQLATTENLSAATFSNPELPRGLFDFPPQEDPGSNLLNFPPCEEQTSDPFDLLSCEAPTSNLRGPAPASSTEEDPFQDLLL